MKLGDPAVCNVRIETRNTPIMVVVLLTVAFAKWS